MEAVSVATVTTLLSSLPESCDLQKAIQELRTRIVKDRVPHFLSMAASYLTVHAAHHPSLFKQLERYYYNEPHSFWNPKKTSAACIYFQVKGERFDCREVPLSSLLLDLTLYVTHWNSKTAPSWKELPASLYRAIECYLQPCYWTKLGLQHYNRKLPREVYFVFHPALQEKHDDSRNPHFSPEERAAHATTLAVLAMLYSRLHDREAVRDAYSRLRYCLLHQEDAYEQDHWLAELGKQVVQPQPNSLFSRLCDLFHNTSELMVSERKESSYYQLKPCSLQPIRDTPIRGLPQEVCEALALHDHVGSLRVLRFTSRNADSLLLHSTMNKLRQSYAVAQLSSDYIIFSGERYCYLVLPSRDHKLITSGLLPLLRINGQLPPRTLPIFLQLADNLLHGRKLLVHFGLQSVYDLVVGWSSKRAYFKKVQPELLRTSVRLLCAYAALYSSPKELLDALLEPYQNYREALEMEDSRAVAMLDVYCPQETIKALLMLDEVHHMRRETFCQLYELVCEKRAGEHSWPEYHRLQRYLQGSYRPSTAHHVSDIITLRQRPYDFLYSYILESGLPIPLSRHLCESLRVRNDHRSTQFRTPIPAQSPGLSLALTLEQDKAAATRVQKCIQRLTNRKHCRSQHDGMDTEKLCMLLQQLEFVRLCSPLKKKSDKKENPEWRGSMEQVPEYLTEVNVEELLCGEEKPARLPFFFPTSGPLRSCKQMFPLHTSCFMGPEVPDKVLHTVHPDIVSCMLYTPLPASSTPIPAPSVNTKRKRLHKLSTNGSKKKRE